MAGITLPEAPWERRERAGVTSALPAVEQLPTISEPKPDTPAPQRPPARPVEPEAPPPPPIPAKAAPARPEPAPTPEKPAGPYPFAEATCSECGKPLTKKTAERCGSCTRRAANARRRATLQPAPELPATPEAPPAKAETPEPPVAAPEPAVAPESNVQKVHTTPADAPCPGCAKVRKEVAALETKVEALEQALMLYIGSARTEQPAAAEAPLHNSDLDRGRKNEAKAAPQPKPKTETICQPAAAVPESGGNYADPMQEPAALTLTRAELRHHIRAGRDSRDISRLTGLTASEIGAKRVQWGF